MSAIDKIAEVFQMPDEDTGTDLDWESNKDDGIATLARRKRGDDSMGQPLVNLFAGQRGDAFSPVRLTRRRAGWHPNSGSQVRRERGDSVN